jgi:hydrogenase maturation protease
MGVTTASTLIIGMGNPILSDDGVGWRVAHFVREMCPPGAACDIKEACVGGLSLAELMIGYRRVIVIDAIMTDGGEPGTIYHIKLPDLPGTLNTASAHDTNLSTALRALRRFGAEVPDDDAIEVVAVEAQDVWTFGERCTPQIETSIPSAASLVMELLG